MHDWEKPHITREIDRYFFTRPITETIGEKIEVTADVQGWIKCAEKGLCQRINEQSAALQELREELAKADARVSELEAERHALRHELFRIEFLDESDPMALERAMSIAAFATVNKHATCSTSTPPNEVIRLEEPPHGT